MSDTDSLVSRIMGDKPPEDTRGHMNPHYVPAKFESSRMQLITEIRGMGSMEEVEPVLLKVLGKIPDGLEVLGNEHGFASGWVQWTEVEP